MYMFACIARVICSPPFSINGSAEKGGTDARVVPLFPVDTSTLITPSEEFGTSCIDGGNYHFQVFPSPHLTDIDMKSDVLIYFQGGGACWDKLSYDMSLCSKNAEHRQQLVCSVVMVAVIQKRRTPMRITQSST